MDARPIDTAEREFSTTVLGLLDNCDKNKEKLTLQMVTESIRALNIPSGITMEYFTWRKGTKGTLDHVEVLFSDETSTDEVTSKINLVKTEPGVPYEGTMVSNIEQVINYD